MKGLRDDLEGAGAEIRCWFIWGMLLLELLLLLPEIFVIVSLLSIL